MNKSQNGFGLVGLVLLMLAVGLIGFAGWKVSFSGKHKTDTVSNNAKDTATGQSASKSKNQQAVSESYDPAQVATIANFDKASIVEKSTN